MKKIKWNIVLAVILSLTLCVSLAALAAETKEVTPSEDVVLELVLENKDGISGNNIVFDNEAMIESWSLDVNGDNANFANGAFFWNSPDGQNMEVKLHINVKISADAQPGDVCNVSLAYRTSVDNLPEDWADYGWQLVIPQESESETEPQTEPQTEPPTEPSTEPENPPMGDSSNVMWMGLAVFAGLGLVMLVMTKKKAEN